MSVAPAHVDPEINNFGCLDDIFDSGIGVRLPQPVDTRPGNVSLFTGPADGTTATAGLYVNGVLHASGDRDTLLTEALVLLGANVYTSDEHLLGFPEGPAAPDLNTISVYTETIEKVEALRRDAEALRAEADYLEDEIRV